MNRTYLCIDLKSFYASVECMELGLHPLTTNLVVADESRTEKTICLAVEKPKFILVSTECHGYHRGFNYGTNHTDAGLAGDSNVWQGSPVGELKMWFCRIALKLIMYVYLMK